MESEDFEKAKYEQGETAEWSSGEMERAVGLSTVHISPRTKPQKPIFTSYAEFYEGGSLGIVKRKEFGGNVGGGKRGTIGAFSTASRRRMMRFLATLQRISLPVFVTLTYPDQFPIAPGEWKRHLDNFTRRLVRSWHSESEETGCSLIWRLELKARKSGENTGCVAPHFHLLVWGIPYSTLRAFVPVAWWEVVGSNLPEHLAAGTRVEIIRSWRGTMGYASKYLAKVDQESAEEFYPNGVGRFWGVVNREMLPKAQLVRHIVTQRQAATLLRYFRRFAHLRSRDYCSLTIFLDGAFWSACTGRMFSTTNESQGKNQPCRSTSSANYPPQ